MFKNITSGVAKFQKRLKLNAWSFSKYGDYYKARVLSFLDFRSAVCTKWLRFYKNFQYNYIVRITASGCVRVTEYYIIAKTLWSEKLRM